MRNLWSSVNQRRFFFLGLFLQFAAPLSVQAGSIFFDKGVSILEQAQDLELRLRRKNGDDLLVASQHVEALYQEAFRQLELSRENSKDLILRTKSQERRDDSIYELQEAGLKLASLVLSKKVLQFEGKELTQGEGLLYLTDVLSTPEGSVSPAMVAYSVVSILREHQLLIRQGEGGVGADKEVNDWLESLGPEKSKLVLKAAFPVMRLPERGLESAKLRTPPRNLEARKPAEACEIPEKKEHGAIFKLFNQIQTIFNRSTKPAPGH